MNLEDFFGKEFIEAAREFAEMLRAYADIGIEIFPGGYTPIEYARIRSERKPQRIKPHFGSGYVPCGHAASRGMIRKNGRWKRRKI